MQNSQKSALLGQIGGAAGVVGTALGNPLVGLGLQAGLGVVGGLLNGRQRPPDLVDEARGQYAGAQRRLGQTLQRNQMRAEDSAAARGLTGSGGTAAREAAAASALDAMAGLEAERADALARAANDMALMEYDADQRARAGRLQALGSLGQTAAFYGMMGSGAADPVGAKVEGRGDDPIGWKGEGNAKAPSYAAASALAPAYAPVPRQTTVTPATRAAMMAPPTSAPPFTLDPRLASYLHY